MFQPGTAREYRLLHLSDTHVGADGPDADGVDAPRALRCLLETLRDLPAIDAVVVTGDIADDGSQAGCALVRDLVGDLAGRREIPHIYTTGNHDDRDGFSRALGSGHLDPSGTDIGRLGLDTGECAAVSMVGGLRVVTLDSLVPGQTYGEISPGQLDWLGGVLAEPAPDGTVLALHHPPVHLSSHPWQEDVVLQDPAALGQIIEGADVHAVLCGHLHLQLSSSLAGVPVWVTPGVVTRIDLTAPAHLVRGVLGAGASVVSLGRTHPLSCHVLHARDERAGDFVYSYDARSGDDVPE